MKYLDEYDGIEEDADWSDGNESDKLSDFEENVDVIGEVHSDCDINEIYVEKGILGKHLRGNQMARSSL